LRDQDADRAERLMRDHVESASRFALEYFQRPEAGAATETS
jgi:hypothetical protein